MNISNIVRKVLHWRHFFPLVTILLFILVVFRKYFFAGLVPMPGDILTGAYYPWLDFKWGYPVSVPVKNPLPSDVFSITYPWRYLGIEMLKAGRLPLWDSSILLGVPLLANFQAALLNPLNVLFFLMPFLDAWSIQVILQLLLLFLFTYIFLENLNLSRYSAVFGALLFAFSGYVMVWLEYNTIVYGVACFPLVLYFADKIRNSQKTFWTILLSFTIAFQIFAGYPLITIYTLATATMYMIFRLLVGDRKKIKVSMLLFIVGIIGGLLLSAVQLIPSYELLTNSIRGLDMTATAGSVKYLPISNLVTLFAPDFYGNPATANYWGIGSYDNFAFFVSAVGVYFFLVALVGRTAFNKSNIVFLLLLTISFLYAVENPLLTMFDVYLPGTQASVNARIIFLASFSISCISAFGLEYYYKNGLTWRERLAPLVVYVLIILSVLILGRHYTEIKSGLDATDSFGAAINFQILTNPPLLLHHLENILGDYYVSFRNLAIPFVTVLLTTILTLRNNKKYTFTMLIVLMLISTTISYDKYLSFTARNLVFVETESISELRRLSANHRFERERAELLPPNSWSYFGLKSPSGQNSLGLLDTARYINIIETSSAKDEILTRYQEISNMSSPLVDTLDVEHFVTLNRHVIDSIPDSSGRPFPWIIPDNYEEVANVGTVRIYQNMNNLGPAWFADKYECLSDRLDITERLSNSEYDPAKLVFIDCDDENINPSAEDESSTAVETIEMLPGYIRLHVETPSANYLTISNSHYPGWGAYIDDEEVDLYMSNIALMALKVPEGGHDIELEYKPKSFKAGAVISIITLISFTFYGVFKYFQKKAKS